MNSQGDLSLTETADSSSLRHRFDTSVIVGLAIGLSLIIFALLLSGSASKFFDPAGFLIVVGGTLASTMIQFSLGEIIEAAHLAKTVMYRRTDSALERIIYFVDLSKKSRRKGTLVLDDEAGIVEDLFLAKALEMTADGTDPDVIRRIMENELKNQADKQGRSVAVFQTMAAYAPAFGLIGTLIGLVGLLGALSSPDAVGPAMSVALMTTLYGALIANLICLPLAGKLRHRSEEDTVIRTITIEGAVSLAQGDNPIVVEQKLQSFLPT